MAQTEHGQVVRRGMFQGIFYSMSKSFFDKIDVEINGNRPGKSLILLEKNRQINQKMIH